MNNSNKFLSLLFFGSFFTVPLLAQTIPNGGFENWRVYPNTIYEVPQSWTDNDILYQRFDPAYKGITVIKTTRSHSGSYALQMGVSFDHNDTVNGSVYSVASLDSLMLILTHKAAAGFPCSRKYATFTGYYIFNCMSGDTAVFGAVLTKWNWVKRSRDTIVNSILRIGDIHTDYVPFVVPLKYRIKNEVPDTAFISIGIQSQYGKSAKIGTALIIDDLKFSGTPDEDENKY